MNELLGLCNKCWVTSKIPKSWKISKVITLFKKGNVTLPQNYRPISLLPVGYKVLAALVHQRLIDCCVDSKICASQYGFRPKRSCSDALMIVRRMIDAASEAKEDGLLMVFLDWAKAFDRIKSDSLVKALERFGLPSKVVQLIGSIYENRKFQIGLATSKNLFIPCNTVTISRNGGRNVSDFNVKNKQIP